MEPKGFGTKVKEYIDDRFYFGPVGLIGIDFGLSAIKFAEVVKSGDGYKLNKYISVDLPEGSIIEDEINKEDEVIKCLQDGLSQLKSSYKWVCLSVSGPNTVIKRLQLPGGTNEEVEDSVFWEIEQYLPYPLEEANISFSILGENSGGGLDVIIGAAKKSLVLNYVELVERLQYKVKVVDLGIAALMNVFDFAYGEEISKGTWVLLDLGAQKSEFIIYKNKVMVFSKEISMGGLTITEEIQRQMGVNYEEAESLKISGDGSGNIPEEIVDIINQVLDTFFEDLKKSIDFWATSSSEEVFEGCYITGGNSQIPGLQEALQEVLGTEVHALNPFHRMTYNQNNIDEKQIPNIVYKGVVAIGLAMREFKKK